MEKVEKKDDLIEVLKEIADEFQPKLFGQLKKKLDEKESEILDRLFESYYRKDKIRGRWWDPYHVLLSATFAVEMDRTTPLASVVPAILLHDIGYYAIEDKDNWDASQSRIIHMQEGTGPSAEILILCGYSPREIKTIIGGIASHDNEYLGIKIKDSYRLGLRDADRAWVMHPLSFYKDWTLKKKKNSDFSLLDLLRKRVASFYDSKETLPVSILSLCEINSGLSRPPYTDLAKQWRNEQFKCRWQEIQDNITEDEEIFRKSIEKHIRAELEKGRG